LLNSFSFVIPDQIRNDNAEESKAAPHPNENNSQDEKIKQHMGKDFVRYKMNPLYVTSWIYNFLIGII